MKQKEQGFSLLSVIGALIIVALLLAAGYRYQKHVSEKRRANELVNVITSLKNEIQAIRGVEDDVGYFEYLEATGATPAGFEPVTGVRRWNTKWGRVYVGGLNSWLAWAPPGFSNGDGVIFAFPAVSNDICLSVIQAVEPQFDFIMYVSDEDHIIKKYDVSYTTAAAVDACNAEDYGETGVLRLMVYK